MPKVIKFIWDYYGAPAEKTAEHHSIHLMEFAEQRNLKMQKTGFEKVAENKAIAYILLEEDEAKKFNEILRPRKAVVHNS